MCLKSLPLKGKAHHAVIYAVQNYLKRKITVR